MSTATIIAIGGALAVVAFILISANRAGQVAVPDVRVLSQLRQVGSKLDQPHKIDFFLYLPGQSAADRVAGDLTAQGYEVHVKPGAQNPSEWLVQANKTMVPELKTLVEIRKHFSALATANGGAYDGWGAEVVR